MGTNCPKMSTIAAGGWHWAILGDTGEGIGPGKRVGILNGEWAEAVAEQPV